jgi:glycogen phosphorylase
MEGSKLMEKSKQLTHHLLRELALNVRWTWDRGADILWRRLEPELWDRTHNPWVVLETVSQEKLNHLLEDPKIQELAHSLVEEVNRRNTSASWFHEHHKNSPLHCIAYFSMEFMLSEALPIYSGGLGNVAGDHLKAASDLGIPIVGIGLLYQQGYFRQIIDKDGTQLALYPYNDPLQRCPRQRSHQWRQPVAFASESKDLCSDLSSLA